MTDHMQSARETRTDGLGEKGACGCGRGRRGAADGGNARVCLLTLLLGHRDRLPVVPVSAKRDRVWVVLGCVDELGADVEGLLRGGSGGGGSRGGGGRGAVQVEEDGVCGGVGGVHDGASRDCGVEAEPGGGRGAMGAGDADGR